MTELYEQHADGAQEAMKLTSALPEEVIVTSYVPVMDDDTKFACLIDESIKILSDDHLPSDVELRMFDDVTYDLQLHQDALVDSSHDIYITDGYSTPASIECHDVMMEQMDDVVTRTSEISLEGLELIELKPVMQPLPAMLDGLQIETADKLNGQFTETTESTKMDQECILDMAELRDNIFVRSTSWQHIPYCTDADQSSSSGYDSESTLSGPLSPAHSTFSHDDEFSIPSTNSTRLDDIDEGIHEPSDTPSTKTNKKGRSKRKTPQLWEFLLEILNEPKYNPSAICWINSEQGIFRFVRSQEVAALWGLRRNRTKPMTYEYLSRGIRHYYKKKVMTRITTKRLIYKFGDGAVDWRTRIH